MVIAGVPVVIYLALFGVIVLLVVLKRGVMRGVTRRVMCSVWCPLSDRRLTAKLEEEVWDGKRVDVIQCSAFSPPTAITCEKSCLRLTKRPRPGAVPSSLPML